jgi:tetratricopeptide (TPR) repeat protein
MAHDSAGRFDLQALGLVESVRNPDQALRAEVLQRLGTMYGLTKAYESSLEFHTKHLDLVRSLGGRGQSVAAALGNVGLAQRINKLNRAALASFEALQRMFLHELGTATPDYARTLMNIGLCHFAEDDVQNALEMLRAAVSAVERLELPATDVQAAMERDALFANITAHLGRVLFRQHDVAVAKRVVASCAASGAECALIGAGPMKRRSCAASR